MMEVGCETTVDETGRASAAPIVRQRIVAEAHARTSFFMRVSPMAESHEERGV
jgi:hypothetical protein